MWLIDTTTLKLKEFPSELGLKYAILSHRWGDDEVLFKDLDGSKDLNLLNNKRGFLKIKWCCEQANRDKYLWAWADTCCIDKSSSAELSEAINSMFHWYRESSMCYVYLSDVGNLDALRDSEWFKRGWTLQELLAPTHVQFFDQNWTFLADKHSLRNELGEITSIPENALLNFQSEDFGVAEKMSWAIGRQTTREEDLAYCLMGLFDINMPLLYGERTKAFWRLQEKIMEFSTDLSILLWDGQPCAEFALLAASPSCFSVELPHHPTSYLRNIFNHTKGWTRNNAGISIRLSLRPHHMGEDQKAVYVGVIYEASLFGLGIFLQRLQRSCQEDDYRRVSVDDQTTIRLATFFERPRYGVVPEFTNLLIARKPMIPLSSVGSSSFTVRWEAPESLEARVWQRPSNKESRWFNNYPVIASELATTSKLCVEYLRVEAQGILGHLLVSISDSLRLLVCFGYDVRYRPLCVVFICHEQFYKTMIHALDIMCVYCDLFGNREQENEAFDSATGVYAVRVSDDYTQFALFDNTLFLSLDVDFIKLEIKSRFLEQHRGEQRSHLGVDREMRLLKLFNLSH